ncbi:hypothetical protein IEI94_10230 [Halomonas sp. ML-15]|uniref:hypothetical protein n=1 Tax=Halomonas sp. ML-15 TaxID=2773305 RepID=UPI0017478979|nr:hypothetical protein [Halomonas sp. ML-15]MBD3896226.1 hypothetical protein [Halomonas sp. ML-15]
MNYIYIGAEKTSSTYLQRFFSKNKHIIYQDYGIHYAGQDLNVKELILRIKNDDGYLSSYNPAAQNARNCLISEFFYRDLRDLRELSNLKHFFNSVFGDYKIILYVRDQRDWLESFYSTYIKNGRELSFNSYVKAMLEKLDPSIDYHSRSERWRFIFPESLEVRMFSGQNLIKEAAEDFGAVFDKQGDYMSPGQINSSLPSRSLRILRNINLAVTDPSSDVSEMDRKALKSLLSKHPIGENKVKLSSKQQCKILERFSKGNEEMNKRWGLSLPTGDF